MHLLSCLSPKRVFNKYKNEYVWVACRECEACLNAHAAKWTQAIEMERKQHRYSFFVTLTYDNIHLPVLHLGDFNKHELANNIMLYPSKKDDFSLYLSFLDDIECDKNEKDLFCNYLTYGGVPYCSSYDIQSFHKRLNKYLHDKVTKTFKNFRFFVCSEFGSTTFRPHFHGIYFVDDSKVAECFEQSIRDSWQQGIIDCQLVEKSAGSYVAQYVNKSPDLPKFYKKGPIRQKFYFSRFPTIGNVQQSDEEIQKLFDCPTPTRVQSDYREGTKFVDVPLSSSLQNRLFPKCFSFGSVSDSTRVALYSAVERFNARNPIDLAMRIIRYVEVSPMITEFDLLLKKQVDAINGIFTSFFNWCRRVYYVSKHVYDNRIKFKCTLYNYYRRILEYWSKKELWLLNQFYRFQEDYSRKDSSSLVMMYPEFAFANFGDLKSQIENFEPIEYRLMKSDHEFYYTTNHLTHYKNGYIDEQILKSDNPFIYKLIKNFQLCRKML